MNAEQSREYLEQNYGRLEVAAMALVELVFDLQRKVDELEQRVTAIGTALDNWGRK